MTDRNYTRMIEEAAEFGRRFPDETDRSIFDFMEDMFHMEYHPDMVISRIIIVAYVSGEDIAKEHAARVYGISIPSA